MEQNEIQTRPRLSLFRWLVERPKQIWLRKAFFQVHLWAGLLLGLYIIVIGVSGSLLVFKEELLPRPHISIATQDLRHCTADQLVRAIDLVNRSYPTRQVYLASCPDEADPLFALTVHNPSQPGSIDDTRSEDLSLPQEFTAYIDPITGKIVGQADQEHSWIHWVDDLHVYLLMGRSGMIWNGVGASVLLALVLTGMALWWPGIRRWKRSLIIDLRRGWKRINWDLHNAVGFWTVLFTLIWATTSIYFGWPKAITFAISRISPITTASYPAAKLAALSKAAATSPATSMDLLAVLHRSQQSSPHGALEGCFAGSGLHPIFTVYMARRRIGDYANTDFVYFDQNTGNQLYVWHRGENNTLGDWLLWLAVPLHFGTSWGLPFKILWACIGLALPGLTITGFLMYWNRYLCNHCLRKGSVSFTTKNGPLSSS